MSDHRPRQRAVDGETFAYTPVVTSSRADGRAWTVGQRGLLESPWHAPPIFLLS
jgi:hypothetical protein